MQSQSEARTIAVHASPSLSHSSDVCHLFDAITLAGFLASVTISPGTFGSHDNQSDGSVNSFIAQAVTEHYQSRAPPTLLL